MAQINIRIDDKVKLEAENTLKEIGISMTSAINIYFKKIVRDKKIPFDLSAYSDMSSSQKSGYLLNEISDEDFEKLMHE